MELCPRSCHRQDTALPRHPREQSADDRVKYIFSRSLRGIDGSDDALLGLVLQALAEPPSSRYLLKLALTDSAPFTVMMQIGAMLVQAPDHPAKVLPAGGVAVSVTTVPASTVAEHAVPQLMPPTLLVTTPGLPVLTLSCMPVVAVAPPPPPPPVPGIGVNTAPTSSCPLTLTVHVAAAPEQAPIHPVNMLPLPGAAVIVTSDPAA